MNKFYLFNNITMSNYWSNRKHTRYNNRDNIKEVFWDTLLWILNRYDEKANKKNVIVDLLSFESFNKIKEDLKQIRSNSALRKIYDTYLDLYDNPNYDIKKQIWLARIAYQEKRKTSPIPKWFSEFIRQVINKLDKENFKDFLEVFVAYHKYFNPNAQ